MIYDHFLLLRDVLSIHILEIVVLSDGVYFNLRLLGWNITIKVMITVYIQKPVMPRMLKIKINISITSLVSDDFYDDIFRQMVSNKPPLMVNGGSRNSVFVLLYNKNIINRLRTERGNLYEHTYST